MKSKKFVVKSEDVVLRHPVYIDVGAVAYICAHSVFRSRVCTKLNNIHGEFVDAGSLDSVSSVRNARVHV